jgi:hypothetical protein
VNLEVEVLDHVLEVVFEFESAGPQACGSSLIVNGAAALAVLRDDASDIDVLEKPLAAWYNENGHTFGALKPLGS